MELASKANVSLDDVNQFERHRPIDDPAIQTRIADVLGITTYSARSPAPRRSRPRR
jgi:hypothetical protein